MMYRAETDTEDAIIFEDILEVSEFIYNDDTDTIRTALKSVYNKHRINAENRTIFAKILATKTPVNVDPMVVQSAINAHLVGSNAKRGAEIWTNATGFAALDQVNSNSGVSLITRNDNGDFVYRNKYIVREFSNENLPNDTATCSLSGSLSGAISGHTYENECEAYGYDPLGIPFVFFESCTARAK